jgi:hypothetical protein
MQGLTLGFEFRKVVEEMVASLLLVTLRNKSLEIIREGRESETDGKSIIAWTGKREGTRTDLIAT